MSDSMTDWIAAYYDGELSSERRAWVEDHLVVCADCRRELDDLRALSGLLHTAPAPASRLSEDEFTRQVLQRLPMSQIPFWNRALRVALRYAPLGLFAFWAFWQAVIIVSGGVLLLIGLFPTIGGRLGGPLPVGGEALEMNLLSWIEQTGLFVSMPVYTRVLNWVDGLSIFIIVELGTAIIFAVLFLAWLAGYWSQRRLQVMEVTQ